MARPVVGITTYVLPARFAVWDLESALVPTAYVVALERAGARPLLVPPSTDGVDETLDVLDGLVFPGGSDLDPELYGHTRHEQTTDVVRSRDDAELGLLRGALARDMPVLAICRGSQLLNVACGGDLVQHLPDVVGHEEHRHAPGTFSDHSVDVEPGTTLERLVGDRLAVKSHHHQGLGRVGQGLRVVARAEDGSAEALEAPAQRFAIGVLWHAEAGDDPALFDALVEEARGYRADRRAG